MPLRITFFSQQQSGLLGGWQENFWNLGSDPVAVQAPANALAQLLSNIKGNQAYVVRYRIASATTFRNVLTVETGYSPSPAGTTGDADYPSTALQLKLTANGGGAGNYKTLQWMRGLPDVIVAKSGTYQPTSAFTNKLNAIFNLLTTTANGWAVNALLKTLLPTPITAFDNATGIVTAPNHGLGAVGEIVNVRIKGTGIRNRLNNLWHVTIINTSTVQINFWVPENPYIPITGKKPTIRKQVYTQVQISTCAPGMIASHKTGRPTGLLGGRRKQRPI